ncbi:ornithine cyclodeaminase family protein [Pseudalkalibacillus berkeleyi]|uniref:Ornithine cyclodeaminase n=1 Tax=Pseudalkalibacillus berkeleyi TaxID=1069813 RepID=A0ABS9H6K2_9BACL|nr:hypothetical protein [Pseudalkalibacillus berkeleyi]MCF6139418.1 hypothetical protein [Pseudalkalibacillus berkeleyi]
MKYIDEDEMRRRVSSGTIIEALEQFFKNKPNVKVQDRIHIDDAGNTVLIMPAFDPDYYAIKLAGVAPDNRQKNKPTIHATVILHDRKTLEPLAYIDGSAITAIRTGAIGGLSMKHLAKESAESIGIIGTGIQGWSHLEAAIAVREIKQVYIYNRSSQKLKTFKDKVQNTYPHLKVVASNIDELVTNSDIIVTTTTSNTPVLPDKGPEFWKGKHIVAVGSFRPDMQELPDALLQNTFPVYVDTHTAQKESGDMLRVKELQGEDATFVDLSSLMDREVSRTQPHTLFKSVGMAIFDLITAKAIYEQSHNQ